MRFPLGCAIVCVVGLMNAVSAGEPVDGNPRTVYFSTGDNQDLITFPPVDSATTIEAAFTACRENFHANRIWWRGGQDEIWGEEFVIRPENRIFARIWDWWRDLQYRVVKTNRIAVAEAKKQGLEIWLTYGLFDNGSQADAGYSGFPYAIEDKLRIEHPEWAPVNKWGTWRQGGPIEFAYPEARQAMADYLTKYVVDGDYDGIAFLTYAENFSQRYEDEFGYSEPIVKEFKKKYGVDIRTEEFDKEAWRTMRGGHITEFLRLLKKQLSTHGKKVAVCVHGDEPNRPMKWLVDDGVRTAGNAVWSIDEWLDGSVVDEICLFSPKEAVALNALDKKIKEQKSPVVLTSFRTRGEMPAGRARIMFLGRELESGYDSEAWIDWPDETPHAEPIESLTSDDIFARRRLLTLALKGKVKLTPEQYAVAVNDDDVYVRRTALRAIAANKVGETYNVVIAALNDPENSVRCLAAVALGEIPAEGKVETLIEAAFEPQSTFQFHFRTIPEVLTAMNAAGDLTPADKQLLVDRLTDDESRNRELVLYYFSRVGAPADPDVLAKLLHIVKQDENPYSRELAIVNLSSSFGATTEVSQAMREVMEHDADHAVQVRAAVAYAAMHARLPEDDPARTAALKIATKFFNQYGDACQRTDGEWGWRVLGNVILNFGPEGSAAMEQVMSKVDDRILSDRAWKILYLKQGDQFYHLTPEEDTAAHAKHPWLTRN
ncbi:MAG: HEAT repeat domain-containing protein [Planctomycetota bacterium]|nr:HEAT repeat domain-containing protein [Planctomycetota bacterium]MDA1215175.1 HEAT repeat domain-containing protein [Planctomycetota bacterium]